VDTDRDGRSASNELRPLHKAGVLSLSLDFEERLWASGAGLLEQWSGFTRPGGRTGVVVNVWFTSPDNARRPSQAARTT